MGIPGPFNAGTDFSAAYMLLQAAQNTYLSGALGTPPAGTDLTHFWMFNCVGAGTGYDGVIDSWIEGVQSNLFYIVDEGLFTNPATGDPWTLPDLRAAAGLPTTKAYDGNGVTAASHVSGYDNKLFIRQREREIHAVGAAYDMCGNAATDGQVARLSWAPGFTEGFDYPFAPTGQGMVHTYSSTSGAWLPTPGSVVDLIDNSRGPPDCVTASIGSLNVVNQRNGAVITGPEGSQNSGVGAALPGDIITWTNLEEVRLIWNILFP